MLTFSNGIDEIKVKNGGEFYPFFLMGLLFFPLLFLIAVYFAAKKKQFNLVIINSLIIYVAMIFFSAFIFTFSAEYVPNTYDMSTFYSSNIAMITIMFFVCVYCYTSIRFMRHVGDYHINQLIKKGFFLVEETEENLMIVEQCAKYKKPFWVLDY